MKTKLTIAQAYKKANSRENSFIVQAVYKLFIFECKQQFDKIPVRVKFVTVDPYKTSKELFRDIQQNTFKVFTGGNRHPIMSKQENAVFRAVHDYYGHYAGGTCNSFSFKGEVKAYKIHRQMFSWGASFVLRSETFFQACYYFVYKHYATQKALITL